jgi:raffinose/stachyose/melibiose transport system permease protein
MKHNITLLAVLKWALLMFLLFITTLPLIWTILSSFKSNQEIFSSSFSIPQTFNFNNYVKALRLDGFSLAFLNTAIAALTSTFLVALISSMGSFALINMHKGKNIIYLLLISGIYIPVITFMLPYFSIARWTGLYDTLLILIVIYTAIGLPLSVLIIHNYMTTIPKEIEESAIIDGCSYPRRFWSIIMPLTGPGLMAASTFNFIAFWNEFFFASLLTINRNARTLQVSMRFFSGSFVNDYAALFAALVLSILPTIIAYIFFQERIISGLTSGAIKG